MDSLGIYYESLNRPQPLSRDEERKLIRKAQAGDKAAMERLVLSQSCWVIKIAKKLSRLPMPLADRIQAGNVGLLKAIKYFDLRRKVRLTTLVARCAIRQINTEAMNATAVVSRPSQWYDRSKRTGMQQRLDKRQLDLLIGNIARMDVLINADVAEDDREVYYREEEYAVWRRRLARVLPQLTSRGRAVLQARMQGLTFAEAGERFGVSRERVRQIEADTINEIQELLGMREPRKRHPRAGRFARQRR